MAMPWQCFCFDFALVHHVAQLCLQRPLAQLSPPAWEGGVASAEPIFL